MKDHIFKTAALLTLAAFLMSCAGGQTPPPGASTDTASQQANPETAPPAAEGSATSAPAPAKTTKPAAPARPAPNSSSSGRATDQGQPATTTRTAPATTTPAPAVKMVTVPEGKKFNVTLDKPLSSASNKTGDSFSATLTKTVNLEQGTVHAVAEGARIEGTLSKVEPATKGMKSQARIELQFETLVLQDGTRIPISASFASEAESRKGKSAGAIAGGAVAGAVLGKIIGKDGKDALIGAVIGGAIGTGVIMGTTGKEIELAAGTPMVLHLDKAIEVPPTS